MWHFIWPILIAVASNTFYNISAKSISQNIHPFAALTVSYVTAAIISIGLYYITSPQKQLLTEIKNVNWASFVLGISIVALEFAYIQVYRVGWQISVASLVANLGLAIVLVVVGILFYKEKLSINQIIGMVLCGAGILFINKK